MGALSRLRDRGIRIDEQIQLGYAREWNRVLEEAVSPEEPTAPLPQQLPEGAGQNDSQRADREGAEQNDSQRADREGAEQNDSQRTDRESAMARQEMARAAAASQEVYRELDRAQEAPATANVLAAQEMEEEIQKLMGRWNAGRKDREKPTQLWQRLHKPGEFQRAYQENVAAREEETHRQIQEETDSLVDVRSLRLMTRSEEYYFPMELDGEVAAIHLQICHGGEKGIVRIELTSEHMGSLKGEFQVRDGVVNGCFMGNHRETVMNLRRSSDIFGSYLPQELRTGQVEYIHDASGRTRMSWDRTEPEEPTAQEGLYATAKAFLQTVRDVEKRMD